MIKVIYGAKGSGKTKRIIAEANEAAAVRAGKLIYITDSAESMEIRSNIRFVDISEYDVVTALELSGFLKGICATDFDVEQIYIDGLMRIVKAEIDDLKPFFRVLEELTDYTKIDFIMTVSGDYLPPYMAKYADIDESI